MSRIGDRPPTPPPPPSQPTDTAATGEAGPSSATAKSGDIAGIAEAIAAIVQSGEKDPAAICEAVVDSWIAANVPDKAMPKGAREELRSRLTEALRDDPLLRNLV